MTSMDDLNAFADSRGEGLHPKLRELFERTLAIPFLEVIIRPDGMLVSSSVPLHAGAAKFYQNAGRLQN